MHVGHVHIIRLMSCMDEGKMAREKHGFDGLETDIRKRKTRECFKSYFLVGQEFLKLVPLVFIGIVSSLGPQILKLSSMN